MHSATIVALSALLAVANAGLIGAPAYGVVRAAPVAYAAHPVAVAHAAPVAYAAHPVAVAHAPVAVSHSTGIVRSAPLVHVAPAHHSLVRVARGLIGAAPVAYASHPVAYASPVVHTYAAAPVVKSVAYSSPIVHAAPVAYASHPVVHAAPVAYAAAPVVKSVAYSSPIVHAAPVAYAAHPAPLSYAVASPVVKTHSVLY